VTNVTPSAVTVAIISGFAFIYMLVLLRKTLQGKFDLYDFLVLSMVAILPAGFALFPRLAYLISHLTGVVFPFVVMFGACSWWSSSSCTTSRSACTSSNARTGPWSRSRACLRWN